MNMVYALISAMQSPECCYLFFGNDSVIFECEYEYCMRVVKELYEEARDNLVKAEKEYDMTKRLLRLKY